MCYINNFSYTCITCCPTFLCSHKIRGNSGKLDKSHVLSARDGHSYTKRIVKFSMCGTFSDSIVLIKSIVAFRHIV